MQPRRASVKRTPGGGSLGAARACAGSPSPGHRLQAGCRVSLFLAPEDAWAPAQGHHVGAPGVATCSQNQPPEDCSPHGPEPGPKLA